MRKQIKELQLRMTLSLIITFIRTTVVVIVIAAAIAYHDASESNSY